MGFRKDKSSQKGPDGVSDSVAQPESEGEEPSVVSASEFKAETLMLERAIGGWRGVFDSATPSLVYLLVYLPTHHLVWAVIAAGAAGLGIAAWRLASKKPIIQIMGGLVGVAISTIITLSSHQARGYFLYGMILNAVYGTAFLLSLLVNRPLLGYLVGGATGDLTGWVRDRQLRRLYAAATWLWVFVFGIRLAVRVPLYLAAGAGAVATGHGHGRALAWLGITGVIMGWPLYLLAAWFTYLLLAPPLKKLRAERAQSQATSGDSVPSETSDDVALDE